MDLEYDDRGNLVRNHPYMWNSESNKWIRYRGQYYAYDENGREIEKIRYKWDRETNEWFGLASGRYI